MIRNSITILVLVFSVPLLAQPGISHQTYDDLLQKYVDTEGMVDYEGLNDQKEELADYLSHLSQNPPKSSWTRNEKLAYWINAYNAFTIDLILQHYPVESIKDLGSTIKIPFVSTAWDIKFVKIGGQEYDLNNIEHGIIRKEFDEPRIHFALVCAAVSCPKLLNRAFQPEKLDQQLTMATKDFLSNPDKNEFHSSSKAALSKIFNWYEGDFKGNGGLIDFINQYAPVQLKKNARIAWKDYDWSLNKQ